MILVYVQLITYQVSRKPGPHKYFQAFMASMTLRERQMTYQRVAMKSDIE